MSHPRAWIAAVVSTAVTTALLAPTVSPADAAPSSPSVVGAQTAGDTLFPHQGNGGYDVSHYDLAIAWATSNVITATATITATTTQQPLEQFSLDLEGLTVSAVTVDGDAATFSRIATGGKFKLVVNPATPVSGAFTTKVTYSGTPVTHTDPDGSSEGWVATTGLVSGVVALNEPVGAMTWYPNNNTPKDKATFTTKLTVPYSTSPLATNRVAVSNGVLASTTIAGSTRTFTWNQPKQQASYLAMVGIGQYTASESDVALTTGTTHEWSYADPTAAGSTQFATSRGKLSAILKGIEKYYGAYPGSSTGLVLDVSSLGYALETQDRPYFENSIDEATLIHELAHQWFGDAVSPADWSDVWLNEGPATFIETQVAADLNGDTSTQDTYYATWNSSSATSAMWTTPSAGFTDSSKLFDSQVYTRGAIALEALRSSLGDKVFAEVMRTWQETYGGGSATTAQFIDVAEAVSGYDLTAFFQTWIYGTTKPATWPAAYELSLTSTPTSGTTVDPGSAVSYALTAQNSGKVSTGASTVEIDASDLVANGTLGSLPAGVTRSGDTLVWAVPATAVSATATTTITATLDHATGGPFAVTARGRTLGADCGTCSSTLTVRDAVLTSADPVVSGTARVGETVTALTAGWTSGTTFTYQWLRDGTPIDGATASTYAMVAADRDTVLSVRVTGSKDGFQPVTRTSPAVTVAPGILSPAPTPTVTGDPRVGSTLTAVAGSWDAGAALTYQWLLDGQPIAGAMATTYSPVSSQIDHQLRVAVTGSRPGYTSETRTSGPLTVTAVDAPVSPTPTITGTPRVGQTLTAVPGDWSDGATLSYQWSVNGSPVLGATATTYTLRAEDRGESVTVAVTGTRTSGVTTRTSEPVTVLAGVLTPTPDPTISGQPRTAQTITAVAGTWDSGATLTYQWLVDGVAVEGETAQTYVVRPTDPGKPVTVAVTGTRPGFTTVTRTSAPVTAALSTQTRQPRPTVKGKPLVGRTLHAYAGAHDTGVRIAFKWYVGSTLVSGATSSTFKVRPRDRGKVVRVLTRASKLGYTTVSKYGPALRVR